MISSHGYVVTNAHVVESGEPLRLTKGLKTATITLKVSSINVCFTAEAMAARGLLVPCAEASVAGADRDRDLAILFAERIVQSSVPPSGRFRCGRHRASRRGARLSFRPRGRNRESGRLRPDLVPDVSATPGRYLRPAGERRGRAPIPANHEQCEPRQQRRPGRERRRLRCRRRPLEAGEGGRDRVPRSRSTRSRIFVDTIGLDQAMPVRRLRLGPLQNIEGKGLSLRLPEGFADRAPFASRVETDAAARRRVPCRPRGVAVDHQASRGDLADNADVRAALGDAAPGSGSRRGAADATGPAARRRGGHWPRPNREIRMDYARARAGR